MTRTLAAMVVLAVCGAIGGVAARGADELPEQARLLEAFRKTVKDPYILRSSAVHTSAAARTSPAESEPDEAAKELLELRDRVGQEVFAGTVFEDETPPARIDPAPAVIKATPRYEEMVASFLREMVERDAKSASQTVPAEPPAPMPLAEPAAPLNCPPPSPSWAPYVPPAIYASPTPPTAYYPGVPCGYSPTVEALRSAAEQLDQAANMLERQNLYAQADEMRTMATKLRQEARRTPATMPPGGVAPAAMMSPVGAPGGL